MIINALNSGADIFMADFEDSNSPTWKNMIEGQYNLIDAVKGTINFKNPEGKSYSLNEKRAVLMVRPRGWHLDESHVLINGEPISGTLFDFGLYFFHNAQTLLKKGSGPYFYLAKMENHLEARLWNEVFVFAQKALKIPQGTIRATVLLETILAAFEMEEILYELKEHSAGLNAGRWDYLFSAIKKFRQWPNCLFPDRAQVTMTVPFMKAYASLLVYTCHKRGAHAIGGMAAFIPSRKDKELNDNALAKVREDKEREVKQGFDGTWVAHPDLVPIAREVFEKALGNKPNQKDRPLVPPTISDINLIQFEVPGARISEEGVRKNINVSLQYISAWLAGTGAVAIFNLMEDTATAEISRAQLWQWLHHPKALWQDQRRLTPDIYRRFADEEMQNIESFYGKGSTVSQKLPAARKLLDQLVLPESFSDFLTLTAAKQLEEYDR